MDGGIIPIWKERGVNSQRYISKVRHLLSIRKVGHSGTLDPEVEGVLPVAYGPATKVLEYMLEADKVYEGQVTLGFSTDTEDQSGQEIDRLIIAEGELDLAEIDACLASLEGKLDQTPPMYSAVRIQGKRLYQLAREGKEVDRPSRQVTIYQLERQSDLVYDAEEEIVSFSFRVACSKGTYIRTLAVEIGRQLGYPAHMSRLTRVESGGIRQENCYTFDQISQAYENGNFEDLVIPMETFLSDFSFEEVNDDLAQRIFHGAQLRLDNFQIEVEGFPKVLTHHGRALAIYDESDKRPGWVQPKKMLRNK